MTFLLIPAVVLVILGVKAETRGIVVFTWRLLTGSRLDGEKHPTNRTWFKRSTKHDDNTREWHKMPRWQCAAIRGGLTVFVLDAATGLLFARRATIISLSVITLAALAWAAHWIYRKAHRWRPSRK